MILKLIKEHLKDTYNVGTAINGSLALKFLETKKTDFQLLTDIRSGQSKYTAMVPQAPLEPMVGAILA